MNRHEFASNVKSTLEKDIKKCLIDTKHITLQDCVILHNQSVALYPTLSYRGTFQVVGIETRLGEFVANTTAYGLTHWFDRPLYNLRISYDGESIYNKGKLFSRG